MKFLPKISIIIVVYNAGSTLEQTLKSVTTQSYPNKQVIIKDAGSTDETLDIIQRYKDKIHLCISNKDAGIYDAMNIAVKLIDADSDFVYFIGADDIFLGETALEDLIHKIGPIYTPEKIFYGSVIYKTAKKIYDGKFNDLKFCLRNICHQAILYPAAVFKEHTYNLRYKYLADFVLNLNLKAENKYKFTYVDSILAIYNDEGSSGQNIDGNFLNDRLKLIKKAFPFWIYMYAYLRFKVKKITG